MKALLLGGTGFFGGNILKKLAQRRVIEHVQVASRSASKAAKVAATSDLSAAPIALDMDDATALGDAVESVDIVLNAAGNAPETAPPAIEAAVRAKKPYVDLSMEAAVLLKAEELIEHLGDPGVPIVLGAGIHPGYTELLGAHAAAALDTVSSVNLHMLAVLEDYGRPDVFIPMFQQGWAGIDGLQTMAKVTAHTAYRVIGGKREEVPHARNTQAFSTLDGHGVDGFVMPSIEALSLHRCFKGSVDTQMLLSFWPPAANEVSRRAAPGLLDGSKDFPTVLEEMWRTVEAEQRPKPLVHFWATARGQKSGQEAVATAFTAQDWGNQPGGTATTAAVFAFTAERVAIGQAKAAGLAAPVELFSAKDVFSVLAANALADVEVRLAKA
jgi:hypothetical protein